MSFLLLIIIYFVLGAGVKYVDAAYDDDTFSRRCALLLSIVLGVIAGLTMIWDRQTLIIFLSLIIGVTITGKLDILPFRILVVIAILILFCLNSHSLYFSGGDCALILLISVGAAIDEIGNDLADAKILKRLIGVFFLYRGYLKILISLIALFHYLPIIYTTAFLTFDLGYLLIARLSAQRQAKQLYHCT